MTLDPCDSRPGNLRPRVPPFVTTSVSGPRGPGTGARAPPACAGAAWPILAQGCAARRRLRSRGTVRAAGTGDGVGEDAPGTALPSGAAAGTPYGSSGGAGWGGAGRGGAGGRCQRAFTRRRRRAAPDANVGRGPFGRGPGVQLLLEPHFLLRGRRESNWMASNGPSS